MLASHVRQRTVGATYQIERRLLTAARRLELYLRLLQARAPRVELRRAYIVDEPQSAGPLRQAQIRVVVAQLQSVLGARGEHPIGLRRLTHDEVVDQDAQVAFVSTQHERLATRAPKRGVRAGQEPLPPRLFVAGGPVDLSCEKEARNRRNGERRIQHARLDEVVLDRVAMTHEACVLQAHAATQERLLDLARQGRRHAIHVDDVGVEPLGLEEDLVPFAIGEAHDLVLDRRTIARPHPFDPPGVHRCLVQVLSNDLVSRGIRVRDVTGDLLERGEGTAGLQERKARGLQVTRLFLQGVPTNRVVGEPRRRAGLQSPQRQRQLRQGFREPLDRVLLDAPALGLGQPGVHHGRQKRSGRQHDGARGQLGPVRQPDPVHAVGVTQEVLDGAHDQLEPWEPSHPLGDRLAIAVAIGLRARRLDRVALAGVQQAELNSGLVDRLAHPTAQGVDLPRELALAEPADRRVAAHFADAVRPERHQRGSGSELAGGARGLGTGVARPDDDHVEAARGGRKGVRVAMKFGSVHGGPRRSPRPALPAKTKDSTRGPDRADTPPHAVLDLSPPRDASSALVHPRRNRRGR